MKVTALTAFKSDPSSRFRVRQFIEPLGKLGIDVTERYLPITRYRRQPLALLGTLLRIPGVVSSRSADITWLRRELIPERVTLERFTGGKRLFDVDDAVWLNSNEPFSERIVEMCDGVIAGNNFLSDHYRTFGKPVWVVPTAVDTELWKPGPLIDDGLWRLGWLGTRYNLRYFDAIEEPLAQFLADHADARLRIVCDKTPEFRLIPSTSVEYIQWTAHGEIAATRAMNVGLMPLEDNDWSRGKCAFKMLCYLSLGVPGIVTPVGVNEDILGRADVGYGARTPEDWFNAFESLYEDREEGKRLGDNGRKLVVEHYSTSANVLKLADIFTTVAGKN